MLQSFACMQHLSPCEQRKRVGKTQTASEEKEKKQKTKEGKYLNPVLVRKTFSPTFITLTHNGQGEATH